MWLTEMAPLPIGAVCVATGVLLAGVRSDSRPSSPDCDCVGIDNGSARAPRVPACCGRNSIVCTRPGLISAWSCGGSAVSLRS